MRRGRRKSGKIVPKAMCMRELRFMIPLTYIVARSLLHASFLDQIWVVPEMRLLFLTRRLFGKRRERLFIIIVTMKERHGKKRNEA